jgi:hypothetical protein
LLSKLSVPLVDEINLPSGFNYLPAFFLLSLTGQSGANN